MSSWQRLYMYVYGGDKRSLSWALGRGYMYMAMIRGACHELLAEVICIWRWSEELVVSSWQRLNVYDDAVFIYVRICHRFRNSRRTASYWTYVLINVKCNYNWAARNKECTVLIISANANPVNHVLSTTFSSKRPKECVCESFVVKKK